MNIPQKIDNIRKMDGLHIRKNHPIELIKNKIYECFDNEFIKFDHLNKEVSTVDNFDLLLISKDHPARGLSDTYYLDENTVLRTHTSAHQNELLKKGHTKFLVTGDVYRKDEINATHYPVFHQMEGVCLVEENQDPVDELKKILTKIIDKLFPNCEYKMRDHHFPFTYPSFEIDVMYNGEWLEILGCGVIHQDILKHCNLEGRKGYAFGLGLERIAMILCNIDDIRYFWTDDQRFHSQFSTGELIKFNKYPILQPVTKDYAFYVKDLDLTNINIKEFNKKPIEEKLDICGEEGSLRWMDQTRFFEICSEICDNYVKEVTLFDVFIHPKDKLLSHAYHIVFESIDQKFKDNAEFTKITNSYALKIREKIGQELNIESR